MEEFLSMVVQGILLLIALLTLLDFLRHRDRTRLDIALMFGALATTILIQGITRVTNLPARWLSTVGALVLLAQPYLLLHLTQHFRAVPPAVRWTALAGLVVSWVLLIAIPPPLPLLLILTVVAYFVFVEGYAAPAFSRGATSYYFAFAPPRWLRRTWQLAELHRSPADLPDAVRGLATMVGAEALLAVPVATREHAGGLLLFAGLPGMGRLKPKIRGES